MRRLALILLTIITLAIPAIAAEDTKPLEELPALRIKVLMLERQVIQEQTGRLNAEAQIQYAEKALAFNRAVEAAAKAAGLDLKEGWQPDVDARVWRKGK